MSTADGFKCCGAVILWPAPGEVRTCPECSTEWEHDGVTIGGGARIHQPCPDWCAVRQHSENGDRFHEAEGTWADGTGRIGRTVFAGVRQWDGEPPRLRLHAQIEDGGSVGEWPDARTARVVAQALDNLTCADGRRAIAAELRASADLLEKAEADAREAEAE